MNEILLPCLLKLNPKRVTMRLTSLLPEFQERILGKKPFEWQLNVAAALLFGEDLVPEVGTGCSETLVFALPLLLGDIDVIIVVSPLSALKLKE